MTDYRRVHLELLDDGHIEGRLYPAPGAQAAVIWVGGIGGGWDTPARGLYPTLATELTDNGIASLRLKFRNPREMEMGIEDVLAAVSYLYHEGFSRLALVGHSLGGAVVIRAAAEATEPVTTVVTLASQSRGAEPVVGRLGPECSLLLLHGDADKVLSSEASMALFRNAQEPKTLRIYPGAGHVLDEVAEEVHGEVKRWLLAALAGREGRSP
ncbi:alpha/beta hydrolase [Thiohalomonas denitrificans]|uniref:Dienelactone hydrolase domain-containing protein n=1 Tax=Thiohalomonas denitrificans TaxID=415747 RepID=A0A1G5QYE3_9GAMM|nr:dienelactone hydrolase family protein [Thiohalomonas denitrificans]SCZ66271.1 hypothetical protein SAMN03097708_02938 [Thiohalomonas denitrificans]